MLNSFLESIKEHFSKRFIFPSLLPVLVFGWLSILLYEILSRQPALFQYFSTQSVDWQIICGSLFLGGVLTLAYFLDTFFVSLLRVYEGYWNNIPVLNWIEKKRKISFQLKWDKLISGIEEVRREIQLAEKNQNKKRTSEVLTNDFYAKLGGLEKEWFSYFPPSREFVMPTFLGNLIRSAELYPLYRYNIDAVIMWTRLQSLLPESFSSDFQNVWSSMRLALNLNILAVVFTLTWSIYSLFAYQHWLATILIIIIGWVIFSFNISNSHQGNKELLRPN